MNAYAVVAGFDPNFANHDWAVTNVKGAGSANDFATVWPNATDDDFELQNYDDAVYFYGGRGAIYKALAKFQSARIRNFVSGHRNDPIHVFRTEFRVTGNDIIGGKSKQIIMLAVADAARDRALAAFRDADLEAPGSELTYRMSTFRSRMESKWPNKLGADD